MLAKADIAYKRVAMSIFVDGEQLLDIREQVRVCGRGKQRKSQPRRPR